MVWVLEEVISAQSIEPHICMDSELFGGGFWSQYVLRKENHDLR